jgi:hypothetical protein
MGWLSDIGDLLDRLSNKKLERKAAQTLGWTEKAIAAHLTAIKKYQIQRIWWKSQERLNEANFDLFFDNPSLITPSKAKITNSVKWDLYIGTSPGDYENAYSVSGYLFFQSGKWEPHEGDMPFLEHQDHARYYSATNIFWARGLGNESNAYEFVEYYLARSFYMQSAQFYMCCRVVTREARKFTYQQAQDADNPSPVTVGSKPRPFDRFG